MIVVAAGDPVPPGILDDLPEAGLVVAADGGYDIAAVLGLRVDVLVGDLDSISDPTGIPGHVLIERHPADKDATDLELALDLVIRERPVRVVVLGGTGGRPDHEYATAALLCSDRFAAIEEIDWLSGSGRAYVIRGRRTIHADIGTPLSLIPFHGDADGIITRGLQWDLDGETLRSGSTRGVSNRLISPVADVLVSKGVVLAVLPAREPVSRLDRL